MFCLLLSKVICSFTLTKKGSNNATFKNSNINNMTNTPKQLQYDSFKEMIENEYTEVCLGENGTWDRKLYTQQFGMYNTDLLAINLGFFPTPSLKMIHKTHKLFFNF